MSRRRGAPPRARRTRCVVVSISVRERTASEKAESGESQQVPGFAVCTLTTKGRPGSSRRTVEVIEPLR